MSTGSAKADRAERLIGAGGIISVQVLNEIANVARRKMGMSWTQTHAFLSTIRGLLPVQALTIDVHETGLVLAERYGLPVYDAMIAASALHADCDTLWSEDMQDGIVLEGRLQIVNPFRGRRLARRKAESEIRIGRVCTVGCSISGGVSIGPGKTACPTEHIVTEPRFEFVKLLLIDFAVAARVEIHPQSAPD